MSLSQHHLMHQLSETEQSQEAEDLNLPISFGSTSSDHQKPVAPSRGNQNDEDAKDGVNESCLHCYISHFIIANLDPQPQLILNIGSEVFYVQVSGLATQFKPLTDRNKSPPVTI